MPYAITKHLQFNLWANKQFADLLATVPNHIYFHENKSSFSSVAKTLVHIWGAENIWLKRMQGSDSGSLSTEELLKNKSAALQALTETSASLLHFVQNKTEAELDRIYPYINLKGEPFESSYLDTLFHVVNHSTYHRGQIITMLREAGIEKVVSTDLIHYIRSSPDKK